MALFQLIQRGGKLQQRNYAHTFALPLVHANHEQHSYIWLVVPLVPAQFCVNSLPFVAEWFRGSNRLTHVPAFEVTSLRLKRQYIVLLDPYLHSKRPNFSPSCLIFFKGLALPSFTFSLPFFF